MMKLHYINIDGKGYAIDKKAEIKVGELYLEYDLSHKPIGIRKHFTDEFNKGLDYKLIATEHPHTLDGLPQFILPNERFKIVDSWEEVLNPPKANKALYTEEDMRKAFEAARMEKSWSDSAAGDICYEYEDEDAYLQSLHTKEVVDSFEVESQYYVPSGTIQDIKNGKAGYETYIPKLDKEGLLVINKVNYKNKNI